VMNIILAAATIRSEDKVFVSILASYAIMLNGLKHRLIAGAKGRAAAALPWLRMGLGLRP